MIKNINALKKNLRSKLRIITPNQTYATKLSNILCDELESLQSTKPALQQLYLYCEHEAPLISIHENTPESRELLAQYYYLIGQIKTMALTELVYISSYQQFLNNVGDLLDDDDTSGGSRGGGGGGNASMDGKLKHLIMFMILLLFRYSCCNGELAEIKNKIDLVSGTVGAVEKNWIVIQPQIKPINPSNNNNNNNNNLLEKTKVPKNSFVIHIGQRNGADGANGIDGIHMSNAVALNHQPNANTNTNININANSPLSKIDVTSLLENVQRMQNFNIQTMTSYLFSFAFGPALTGYNKPIQQLKDILSSFNIYMSEMELATISECHQVASDIVDGNFNRGHPESVELGYQLNIATADRFCRALVPHIALVMSPDGNSYYLENTALYSSGGILHVLELLRNNVAKIRSESTSYLSVIWRGGPADQMDFKLLNLRNLVLKSTQFSPTTVSGIDDLSALTKRLYSHVQSHSNQLKVLMGTESLQNSMMAIAKIEENTKVQKMFNTATANSNEAQQIGWLLSNNNMQIQTNGLFGNLFKPIDSIVGNIGNTTRNVVKETGTTIDLALQYVYKYVISCAIAMLLIGYVIQRLPRISLFRWLKIENNVKNLGDKIKKIDKIDKIENTPVRAKIDDIVKTLRKELKNESASISSSPIISPNKTVSYKRKYNSVKRKYQNVKRKYNTVKRKYQQKKLDDKKLDDWIRNDTINHR